MELSTPPPKAPVEGTSQPSAAAFSRKALIVRMPEHTEKFDGTMRRWLDRMEVDEMILREEIRRKANRNVSTVLFNSPLAAAPIDSDTDIYFVGHGMQDSFADDSNEDDLAQWIRQRATKIPLTALKVKLVTCNAGGSDYSGYRPEDCMVNKLAQLLKGVATGRVVAFTGYLLSVPECKMVYAKEPGTKEFKVDTPVRQRAWLGMFKELICKDLAALLAPEGKVGPEASGWLCNVFAIKPIELEPVLAKGNSFFGAKPDKFREYLAKQLESGRWIKWPAPNGDQDLEQWIAAFETTNKGQVGEIGNKVAAAIIRWNQAIVDGTRAEWSRRKLALADAYLKQEMGDKPFEIKQGTQKRMLSRVEFAIPT